MKTFLAMADLEFLGLDLFFGFLFSRKRLCRLGIGKAPAGSGRLRQSRR